jgi:hypothetical protein
MARKQKKYHYIYKTICNLNGKYYIGMHSTNNINDGYLGSGKRLWNSINYYGKENFTKEIIEFCEDRKELKNREKEIVNKELLNEELCMNLQVGGGGGFTSEEHMIKCSIAGNQRQKWLIQNDENFKKRRKEIGLENKRHRYKFPKGTKIWLGRKHSDESKIKIGKKNSINQLGKKNSQYGTCWITKNNINKKIKVEELSLYLLDGWVKGRSIIQ